LLAAAILIEDYRTYRGPKAKQEPIAAEESKLILRALADADWKEPLAFTSLRPNATQLFQRLNVTANDGFNAPKGGNQQEAIQMWLKRNADTYRIQRYVAGNSK
jgi:hypothetical protein